MRFYYSPGSKARERKTVVRRHAEEDQKAAKTEISDDKKAETIKFERCLEVQKLLQFQNNPARFHELLIYRKAPLESAEAGSRNTDLKLNMCIKRQ